MPKPYDFPALEAVEERLLQFQEKYESIAQTFEWRFTRDDLSRLLAELSSQAKAVVAAI